MLDSARYRGRYVKKLSVELGGGDDGRGGEPGLGWGVVHYAALLDSGVGTRAHKDAVGSQEEAFGAVASEKRHRCGSASTRTPVYTCDDCLHAIVCVRCRVSSLVLSLDSTAMKGPARSPQITCKIRISCVRRGRLQ